MWCMMCNQDDTNPTIDRIAAADMIVFGGSPVDSIQYELAKNEAAMKELESLGNKL